MGFGTKKWRSLEVDVCFFCENWEKSLLMRWMKNPRSSKRGSAGTIFDTSHMSGV